MLDLVYKFAAFVSWLAWNHHQVWKSNQNHGFHVAVGILQILIMISVDKTVKK